MKKIKGFLLLFICFTAAALIGLTILLGYGYKPFARYPHTSPDEVFIGMTKADIQDLNKSFVNLSETEVSKEDQMYNFYFSPRSFIVYEDFSYLSLQGTILYCFDSDDLLSFSVFCPKDFAFESDSDRRLYEALHEIYGKTFARREETGSLFVKSIFSWSLKAPSGQWSHFHLYIDNEARKIYFILEPNRSKRYPEELERLFLNETVKELLQ